MWIVRMARFGLIRSIGLVRTRRTGPIAYFITIFTAMNELIESQRNYFLAGHTRSLSVRKKNLRKLHDLLLANERILAD
ncbi:MAG: hypothetical protein KAT15_11850, partial [Bacteroidales bacterium]|nr:hypothetical protein [Bacteroidales bacterium]